jgi:hypothetical protein
MKRLITASLCLLSVTCIAQSPGQIVRPAGGTGVTVLNPDGNGYSSANTAGFTTSDIAQSEILYKVVPPSVTEPTGDIATGPAGGFTDIVKTVDNSGFYTYSDGVNLLFRLRIGNIISGSKGYSIVLDTDGRMGNSGPSADPDYVAATNTANGNPGFEYEVVLQTNFQVAVYQINGTTSPGAPVATYPLNTHSQISMALSTDGNNPDYFYDWYVPLSAIGSPPSFRMAATTVTSPSSALQGSRSDVYGIDDATGGSVISAWASVINAQPTIPVANLGSGGSGIAAVCTAPPVVNAPIVTGSNINVTGTWTRQDALKPSTATITLYRNGVPAGTVGVNSGNTWSIPVTTVSPGDVFFARSVASGESECLQSISVTAGCSSLPTAPVVSCASTKGITGTVPLGSTISIYQVTTANGNPATTLLTTGLTYVNNATTRTFNYYGTNPQSGDACQGQNNLLPTNSTYMLISSINGCLSTPTFICITGASQTQWNYIASNAITLTTPIYPYQTTVSGTGATTGQVLRLFINNQYVSSITASASTFSFTGLSLKQGDAIRIYAQTSSICMTQSAAFTVSCYTPSPTITTTSTGNLSASATVIGGTAASPGGTVQLYRGTAPSGTLVGSGTVNSNGTWTISGLTLAAGETYYATLTTSGCMSGASVAAGVQAATTVCPAFSTGSYGENATSVDGTLSTFTGAIRLYLDGSLIGSTAVTNATTWSIPVNTTYNNTLYTGGTLRVTAQASSAAENTSCASTASITCVAPTTPTVSPLTTAINQGQSVSFNISNVASNTWYSVRDNSGTSYATSSYSTGTGSFNMATNNFSTPGTYSLNISADRLTGCPAALQVASVTVNSVTVPVTFVHVSAKEEHGTAYITWVVTNEQQVSHYEIERSIDCQHFSSIGRIDYKASSAANNTYRYMDHAVPFAERFCYRIRQVDEDGDFLLSAVLPVYKKVKTLTWTITPNPAHDQVTLVIQSPSAMTANILLYNMQGALVRKHVVQVATGTSTQVLNGVSHLPAGTYLVKLESDGHTSTQQLFIR